MSPLCGSAAGIRAHYRLEEPLCGMCAHHERVLLLEAERLRPVPPKPPVEVADSGHRSFTYLRSVS